MNAGTIFGEGSHPAVQLAGGNSRMIVEPHAVFSNDSGSLLADVLAAGVNDTLEFAPGIGALTGIGTAFTNFNSIVFDPGATWFIAGNSVGLGAQISGFAEGDTLDIDGFAAQGSSYLNGVLTLTDAADGMIALNLPGSFTTDSFIIGGDGNGGTEVGIACFLAGTRIATPRGDVAVETLAIGDVVRTASGASRPVRWIGYRSYSGRFIAGNRDVLPIVFRRGALADGVPARDLAVSPRHAMFLDGVLIAAELLVNGVSVYQRTRAADVTYLHVELDSHDILLAESAPAETFIDHASRTMFHNAHEFLARAPGAADIALDIAPRVEDGEILETVRRRIAARAGLAACHAEDAALHGPLEGRVDLLDHQTVSGWAFDATRPHTPVPLEVLVDGVPVTACIANIARADLHRAGIGNGRCAFAVCLPRQLTGTAAHTVQVRRVGDNAVLEERVLHGDPAMPRVLDGRIDNCDTMTVEGWAIDTGNPDVPVRLEVLEGRRVIGQTLANRYRSDLEHAGLASGWCSFIFRFDPAQAPEPRRIKVRRASDRAMLWASAEPVVAA